MLTSTLITLIFIIVFLFGGAVFVSWKAINLEPVSDEEMERRIKAAEEESKKK